MNIVLKTVFAGAALASSSLSSYAQDAEYVPVVETTHITVDKSKKSAFPEVVTITAIGDITHTSKEICESDLNRIETEIKNKAQEIDGKDMWLKPTTGKKLCMSFKEAKQTQAEKTMPQADHFKAKGFSATVNVIKR
ncbi:MAG: hypothetical protein COB76_02730 [Alphaproteobacteria bacterium]|nr:MAG: hypothetical protein COB76_02730 [Alphaproteobacteria bacterium]